MKNSRNCITAVAAVVIAAKNSLNPPEVFPCFFPFIVYAGFIGKQSVKKNSGFDGRPLHGQAASSIPVFEIGGVVFMRWSLSMPLLVRCSDA
ncbi:hypothetical protein [Dysosmobacter welbionis]